LLIFISEKVNLFGGSQILPPIHKKWKYLKANVFDVIELECEVGKRTSMKEAFTGHKLEAELFHSKDRCIHTRLVTSLVIIRQAIFDIPMMSNTWC
jgi:hypothetical protein